MKKFRIKTVQNQNHGWTQMNTDELVCGSRQIVPTARPRRSLGASDFNTSASICVHLWFLFFIIPPLAGAAVAALPEFDFTQPAVAREWGGPHHISSLRLTAEGLEITISGNDPYFHGPGRDFPADTPLWLNIRLKSDEAGSGEVFYFRKAPDPEKSVHFSVPAGEWTDARVPLPALGTNYRLRLDPPGQSGKMLLANMRFEKRVKLPPPAWPAWMRPEFTTERLLTAGALAIFAGTNPFTLEVMAGGKSMAFAHPRPRIAYVHDEQVRWIELAAGAVRERIGPDEFAVTSRTTDPDGAEWTWRSTFRVESAGTIANETTVTVNRDRAVVYLPMHTLIAGEKSFGAKKGQGLLGGLEYLDDEPSSSEADIAGPEANRRVPDSHKITMPLMAIQARERYVGLIWEHPRQFSALFDSPDRTFGSGGHVMGVMFPGSDARNREEGSVLPYYGETLKANAPLVSRAWIIGGTGESVVPAVQHYVKLRGWPDLPQTGLSLADYVTLAAQGWLESKCRETNFYRHAVWPGFKPQSAADAAVFETWLAAQTKDAAQATALREAARGALSVVNPQSYYHSTVSHVRAPAAPLVFGGVREAVEVARQTARGQLKRFNADGSIPYRASRNGVDYGKTHFAPDANGLTAQVVATLLEAAAFCGDRELIAQGIEKLRALDKFRDTVPRGAQTWEVPLHTPDILASAHLVRAYTLGYELTAEREFLDQAIYWAWTGVPFVYLVNPTGQRVGPYSTIAVLGATSWKAPVWFGRPVQWCGLVYADALYRLAPHDGSGPWKKLADGITAAGLQHTWRADDRDRVGLLPDYYELKPQTRAGPAINPGTVGANAVRLYGRGALYEFRALRDAGLPFRALGEVVTIHAPGEIAIDSEGDGSIHFTVRGWPSEPYFVLVNGIGARTLKVNGAAETHEYDANERRLVLKVTGHPRVELSW